MKRLTRKNCPDTHRYTTRILQFGTGNFLRGFADWMVQEMNRTSDYQSGVTLVQSCGSRAKERIEAQHGLYHVVIKKTCGESVESVVNRIDCVNGCLDPSTDMAQLLALAADPNVKLVVSNTTEAGICLDPRDVDQTDDPVSFPARIARLLHHRYQTLGSDGALAVICCEMIDNAAGKLLELVNRISRQWGFGDDFIQWLNTANAFCSSLVDRIVPGYPGEEAEQLHTRIGYNDQLLVEAEDYYAWVIEAPQWVQERFPATDAGLNVSYTDNLQPYRERKVKILNGAHTATVAIALLQGFETVSDTVADTVMRRHLEELIDAEVCPTIDTDQNQLRQYGGEILKRFASTAIRHQWRSIALNSLSKWQVRVLPTIVDYHDKFQRLPEKLVLSGAALAILYSPQALPGFQPDDNPDSLQAIARAWTENGDIEQAIPTVCATMLEILCPDIKGELATRILAQWQLDIPRCPGFN